ncbi:MAG: pyridoxamine 5'-phosphate oxidase family protein, partial [Burkholderiales bacterium]
MTHRFTQLMFTPTVKKVQQTMGSRGAYQRFEAYAPDQAGLGAEERDFIFRRDSFYMATVSETGWPYVQHRGGPRGFLKVLDDRTLGFADYRGNRQYVSVGNLEKADRVSLFLMDYANRRRLKLLGHARLVDRLNDPETLERLQDVGYGAHVE